MSTWKEVYVCPPKPPVSIWENALLLPEMKSCIFTYFFKTGNCILNPFSWSDHGFSKISWESGEDGGRFKGDICFSPDWRIGESKIFTLFVTSVFFFSSFKTRGQSTREWTDCWLLCLKAPKIAPVKAPCSTSIVLLGWKTLSAFQKQNFKLDYLNEISSCWFRRTEGPVSSNPWSRKGLKRTSGPVSCTNLWGPGWAQQDRWFASSQEGPWGQMPHLPRPPTAAWPVSLF